MNNPRGPGRPGFTRGAPQPPPGRPRPGQPARPFKPAPAKLNPLPIIFGAVGILLVVLLFLVMSGGGAKPAPVVEAPPAPKPAAPPKPVDVSGLERDGRKMCQEGQAILRSLETRMNDSGKLSVEEQRKLKVEVKKGLDLLKKGLEYYGEANEKSGRTYDLSGYMQIKKYASNIYQGLPD